MNLTMTVQKEGDDCQIFADVFPICLIQPIEFAMTARPATFIRKALFTQDSDDCGPLLTLPLEDAKKMAKEILKL